MNILETIRNARPGTMVDIRTLDNQVSSFPIDELWKLIFPPVLASNDCTRIPLDMTPHNGYGDLHDKASV